MEGGALANGGGGGGGGGGTTVEDGTDDGSRFAACVDFALSTNSIVEEMVGACFGLAGGGGGGATCRLKSVSVMNFGFFAS